MQTHILIFRNILLINCHRIFLVLYMKQNDRVSPVHREVRLDSQISEFLIVV